MSHQRGRSKAGASPAAGLVSSTAATRGTVGTSSRRVGSSSSSGGGGSSSSSHPGVQWFLIGAVRLNSMGEEALLSVKARKSRSQADKVVISTSDIPPLPVGARDVLRVAFWLESSISEGTRHLLVELAVAGDALVNGVKLSATIPKGAVEVDGSQVTCHTKHASWHFVQPSGGQEDIFLASAVTVRIPADTLLRYVRLK